MTASVKPFSPKLLRSRLKVVTMATIPKSAGARSRDRTTVLATWMAVVAPVPEIVAPALRTAIRLNSLPSATGWKAPRASNGIILSSATAISAAGLPENVGELLLPARESGCVQSRLASNDRRARRCDQVVAPPRNDMEWIAEPGHGSKQRICGGMLHLGIFHPAFGESGLLELPVEMIAAVFQHVTESDIGIRVLKMVKDSPPQRHIHQVSEAVQVRRGADDDAARPQNPADALEHDVAGYRQVLDDFREKNEIEFRDARRLGIAQVPMHHFHAMLRHVKQMWPGKVRHHSAVVP